jgi:hypothetical protein
MPGPTDRLNYSKAPEALVKQGLDKEIAAKGIAIDKNSGEYWSALIDSAGGQKVSDSTDEVQIYIINGGWEGFLSQRETRGNANRARWDDRKGTTDINDALVLFDAKGNFLGAAQLAVPNYYPRTRQMMDREWNGERVFVTHSNLHNYTGLAVLDSGKLAKFDPQGKNSYWIDLHHKVGTLGCVETAASTKGLVNFDRFVGRIGRVFGTHKEAGEQIVAGGNGQYSSLGSSATKLPQASFEVRRNFIGHMHMVSLPTPVTRGSAIPASIPGPPLR